MTHAIFDVLFFSSWFCYVFKQFNGVAKYKILITMINDLFLGYQFFIILDYL